MLTALLLHLAAVSAPAADAPRVIFDVSRSRVQLVDDAPKISNEQYVRESAALNATRESFIAPGVMLGVGGFFLTPGLVFTLFGAALAAGGSFTAAAGLVLLLIGIPPLLIGLALLIPGIVLLVSRLEHNRELDRQIQDLERRRLPPTPVAPPPAQTPETVPLQVQRSQSVPLFAFAF